MKSHTDWEQEIKMNNVWKIVSWTVAGMWFLILVYVILQVWD